MRTQVSTPERSAEVRRILTLVLWLNVGVLAIKLVVWALSGATSVLAESMHSGLDAANNVFALSMARVAARAPDADHPYGHGKFETIGALALVGVLSITVFELVQHSLLRLADDPTVPDVSLLAFGLMGFSLVAGFIVSRYETAAGRRLDSPLLLADAAHTRADVLATAAVLVGLGAMRFGYGLADPLATILVAVLIARTGWEIIRESVPILVDERAVHPMRIQGLATDVDGVESAYSIRSRGRPGHLFAELTIAVDRTLDVETSHDIADRVESAVAEALAASEVVVHVEPAQEAPGAVTFLQEIPTVLLVLPAISLAAGLDLYLTLLVLGLSPHTGLWDTSLPGALGDLDSAGVHLVAGGFYLLEVVAERWPTSALVWNGFHAVIRPLAGALLTLLLLEGQPTPVVVAGAVTAALLASLAHAVRTGAGITLWLRGATSPNRGLLSAAEDVVALAFLALALDLPEVAAAVGTAVALVAFLRSPSDVRAFVFALELAAGRVFGSLSRARWRTQEEFPAWLDTELQADVATRPGLGTRGSPVGAAGLLTAPRFARGWLVSLGGTPSFVYRSRRGPRRVPLERLDAAEVSEGALFRLVDLQADSGPAGSLCVPLSGPSTQALAAEFRP